MSTIRDSLTKDTVYLGEGPAVVLIDQTLLPNEVKWLHLTERKEMWEAIYLLKVRGAPAIGVAAAIGMYVLAAHYEEADREAFVARFKEDAAYLNSSRPTAVNLSWGLKRMQGTLDRILGSGAALSGESERGRGEGLLKPDESDWREEVLGALRREAQAIHDEDIEVCRRIGENGLPLLKDGDGVLTHCNAGKLATIQYGTATAPLYLANERGMRLRVYCDETRPLLQGARLTAFELSASGIDTTLLCDNMSASLMRQGKVNSVFVGCDRVAANGDVANKIGTSVVAAVAAKYGVPFYVCAPTSTIDLATRTGEEIVIERRPEAEVTDMWYEKRMAPKGIQVYNPAFDVTDHADITGIITEYGIVYPPYEEGIRAVMEGKRG